MKRAPCLSPKSPKSPKAPSPRAIRTAVAALALLCAAARGFAYQSSFWRHVETGYFKLSYDARTAGLVPEALRIAEETRESLIVYFGDLPTSRKVSIVLSDATDDPNGEASERDFLVRVDCRKGPSLFRGESDWLRTVLTHELSHVYSLALLTSPLVLRTWVGLDSGLDGIQASAAQYWGDTRIPVWFIEGLAQMGSASVGADSRDPIREMVLRDAALGGRLLDLQAMARFEGGGLDMELAYNQGFSFLRYLEASFPELSLEGLCALVKRLGMARAFARRYGESLPSLYGKWKDDLLARCATQESWAAGERLFDREGLLVLETACAAEGAFVVASWGQDYERLGLFAKGRRGAYARIADGAGMAVKADRETGEIWFARRGYDYASGVEDYDLYRLEAGGKPRRVTRGARSLAFDALGGHLIYAAYRDGRTTIVSRRPDGRETALARLPPGTAAYSISALTKDTALVSVGTGRATEACLLAGGELRSLWAGVDAEGAAFAGGDRVVFSSSVGGSPQVYWADLAEDPRTWYQVTGATAGARFPSYEEGLAGPRLYFSQFEGGGYRLYALADPFRKDRPRRIEDAALAQLLPLRPDSGYRRATKALANAVTSLWPLSIGLYATRPPQDWPDAYVEETEATLSLDLGLSIFDAPEDAGLDLSLGLELPILDGKYLPLAIFLGLDGSFALGPTRNFFGYGYQTSSQFDDSYGASTYAYNRLYAETHLQLSANQAIGAVYSYRSYTDTTPLIANEYFSLHSGGLRWSLADSPRSLFDQAGLGGDWYRAKLAADLLRPRVEDDRYYSSATYLLDPGIAYRLAASFDFHALLARGKLGLGGALGGYSFLGAVEGAAMAPNVLPWLGGAGAFGGYPAYYARLNDLAYASLEIEANPFADSRERTRGVQRWSLAMRLDAGIARYVGDHGLELGYPLSVEASLRHRFYLAPSRESSAFVSVAMPLNDFLSDLGSAPLQLYAGYGY